MKGEFIIIALVAAVAVLALLIAKLASFLRFFAQDIREIRRGMDCAADYEEYRRWRGELRCLCLCLIPFVNRRNVMRVYHVLFHRGSRAKTQKRGDSIAALLMPSVLGICICLVCVCGMTWAWYSASVRAPLHKMTAAYYEVTVESVMNGAAQVGPEGGGYLLDAGIPYTVRLKAAGNAAERGGYCLIENKERALQYYTETFKPEESITIVFTPSAGGRYTFTGTWGSHPVGVTEQQLIKRAGAENPAAASAEQPGEPLQSGDTTPETNPDPAPVEPAQGHAPVPLETPGADSGSPAPPASQPDPTPSPSETPEPPQANQENEPQPPQSSLENEPEPPQANQENEPGLSQENQENGAQPPQTAQDAAVPTEEPETDGAQEPAAE